MEESTTVPKLHAQILNLQKIIDDLDEKNASLHDEINGLNEELHEQEKKMQILYSLARLVRNTDGLHPSTQGPATGKLLLELRLLDGAEYALKVM